MKALKESKKTSRRQPGIGGSSEGTGVSPGVPNESTVIPATSKQESEYSEEESDDELVHADKQVNDDEDEEMTNAEHADMGNGDEEITDTTKVEAEKTKVEKDDIKKAELPPTSSSLSISSGFEIPHIQSPYVLNVHVFVISEPLVLTPIPETPLVAHATTLQPPATVSSTSHVLLQTTTPIPTPPITTEAPPVTTILDPLHAITQRVSVLEKDVHELKKDDNTTTLHTSLRSEIPSAVNAYLGSSLGDALQKELQKHIKELMKKYPQQVNYKEMIEESVQVNIINENALEKTPLPVAQSSSKTPSSLKAAESLSEYELKTFSLKRWTKGKKTKRSRTKESEPSKKSSTSKETSKGKSSAKTSKSGKFVTTEEPVKEPVIEMASDDIEQTVNDFKQPPRPSTPDPEWNKRQVVVDQPEQSWFNQMVSAVKDPLTFDEQMATPIDFSNIELEYNMEECFKALTDKLDWNNSEGDRCPFDLTKPLPLKGRPGRLTVVVEYFFNNDLEFLKSLDPEKKYTTSITKTKAARYKIIRIKDMVPTLWSATKVGYNKDAKKGIKH
ncbi:hypothetical protein Tco_0705519 [Tanacetum coccineum]|uniref:Uncharacterized protein n=1 Tax=Tanacetum coccineum TaxID=301880 RepID=A0ABQ4Y6T3_9ASTR